MTSSDIFIPCEAYDRPRPLARACETMAYAPADPRGTLLEWSNQPTEDGVIINARIAGGAFPFEPEASSRIRMILNDQQLRALAIDLVKTSMMRGIQF
ncbi:hypothetical protein U1872_10400 [Sphingomonas sp. RB3P16]|uniref:hypothetical protein n=1 Tax=Parasphingomonas frigoris TaxID=3096163 RepID=UPI002FC83A47